MSKVLDARIQAFLEEFPFLKRYTLERRISPRPTVERVDLDLLSRIAMTRERNALDSGRYNSPDTRFYLINSSGEELMEVKPYHAVKVRRGAIRDYFGTKWERVDGDSIYEALMNLRDPDEVVVIAEINDKYKWLDDPSYNDYGVSVIVHKVPKKYTLSKWLPRLKELAREELSGELEKMDAIN